MTTIVDTAPLHVEAYDLRRLTLPPQVFAWEWQPDRSALLVHDMQHYFLRPFADASDMLPVLIDRVAGLIALARAKGIPIYWTAQPGGMSPRERGLLMDLWGVGMGRDDRDRSIDPRVAPREDEIVLTKWRYSAFHRSDLADRVADHGRDQLVVCGVYTHVGIQATVIDAFSRDIRPFLVADATADFTKERHQQTIDYLTATSARVVASSDLIGSA